MTRVENLRQFQVFAKSLMFHAGKKSPLSVWEKMFSIWALGISRNCEWTRKDTLLWTRELREIDQTSFSLMKIKARNNQNSDNGFNSTPLAILSATRRRWNDFGSTFSWRESARLKTFFLISQRDEAKEIFKLEIDWSFQIVSHLRFIVLWRSCYGSSLWSRPSKLEPNATRY